MTRRTLLVGSALTLLGTALMLLPLVIPLGAYAKYVVAPGFVGACIGLSICANALLDRWTRK